MYLCYRTKIRGVRVTGSLDRHGIIQFKFFQVGEIAEMWVVFLTKVTQRILLLNDHFNIILGNICSYIKVHTATRWTIRHVLMLLWFTDLTNVAEEVTFRDVDNSRKPGKLPGSERDFSGCEALLLSPKCF